MTRPVPSALLSGAMLLHFTRASKTHSALDNLIAILRARLIRSSSRMVLGGRPVVSLFDVPLSELARLLVERNRRRYEPFGIALDKRYVFKLGARAAVYLPRDEGERLLARDELWRVVTMDLSRSPAVDWTFEREWRMPGDLPLPAQGAVALVERWRDADEIYTVFAGHPPCAGVLPLAELFGGS